MSKRTRSNILLSLMFSSGFLLLISSLPVGVGLALQSYYEVHLERREAFIVAAAVTVFIAVLGGVLLFIGEFIVKRRRKLQGKISV